MLLPPEYYDDRPCMVYRLAEPLTLPNPLTLEWLKANICNCAGGQLNTFAMLFGQSMWVTRANCVKAATANATMGYMDILNFAGMVLNDTSWKAFRMRERSAYVEYWDGYQRRWDQYNQDIQVYFNQYKAGTITWAQYVAIREPIMNAFKQESANTWRKYRVETANAFFDNITHHVARRPFRRR